jgi:hypothetical protein
MPASVLLDQARREKRGEESRGEERRGEMIVEGE